MNYYGRRPPRSIPQSFNQGGVPSSDNLWEGIAGWIPTEIHGDPSQVPPHEAPWAVPVGQDTVPAMLTPGEGVLNREAMELYGTDTLNNMNQQGLDLRSQRQTGVRKATQRDRHGNVVEVEFADHMPGNLSDLDAYAQSFTSDALKSVSNRKPHNGGEASGFYLDSNKRQTSVPPLPQAVPQMHNQGGTVYNVNETTGHNPDTFINGKIASVHYPTPVPAMNQPVGLNRGGSVYAADGGFWDTLTGLFTGSNEFAGVDAPKDPSSLEVPAIGAYGTQTVPPGYHGMPDGSIMPGASHTGTPPPPNTLSPAMDIITNTDGSKPNGYNTDPHQNVNAAVADLTQRQAADNSTVPPMGSDAALLRGSSGYQTSKKVDAFNALADATRADIANANSKAPPPIDSTADFIAKHEGFRDKAYDDGTGVWTIGYGRIANPDGSRVQPGQTTTHAAEQQFLKTRVSEDKQHVLDYAKKYGYDWRPNQVDALTSFTYNLGKGGLDQLTAGGSRSDDEILNRLPEYNRAGGKQSQGLLNRRSSEAALFAGQSYGERYGNTAGADTSATPTGFFDWDNNTFVDPEQTGLEDYASSLNILAPDADIESAGAVTTDVPSSVWQPQFPGDIPPWVDTKFKPEGSEGTGLNSSQDVEIYNLNRTEVQKKLAARNKLQREITNIQNKPNLSPAELKVVSMKQDQLDKLGGPIVPEEVTPDAIEATIAGHITAAENAGKANVIVKDSNKLKKDAESIKTALVNDNLSDGATQAADAKLIEIASQLNANDAELAQLSNSTDTKFVKPDSKAAEVWTAVEDWDYGYSPSLDSELPNQAEVLANSAEVTTDTETEDPETINYGELSDAELQDLVLTGDQNALDAITQNHLDAVKAATDAGKGTGAGNADGVSEESQPKPDELSAVKGIFTDALANLGFGTTQILPALTQMLILYLGSRLTGASSGGSLRWAAGLVAQQGADRYGKAQDFEQKNRGLYTDKTMKEFLRTYDPSVLKLKAGTGSGYASSGVVQENLAIVVDGKTLVPYKAKNAAGDEVTVFDYKGQRLSYQDLTKAFNDNDIQWEQYNADYHNEDKLRDDFKGTLDELVTETFGDPRNDGYLGGEVKTVKLSRNAQQLFQKLRKDPDFKHLSSSALKEVIEIGMEDFVLETEKAIRFKSPKPTNLEGQVDKQLFTIETGIPAGFITNTDSKKVKNIVKTIDTHIPLLNAEGEVVKNAKGNPVTATLKDPGFVNSRDVRNQQITEAWTNISSDPKMLRVWTSKAKLDKNGIPAQGNQDPFYYFVLALHGGKTVTDSDTARNQFNLVTQ